MTKTETTEEQVAWLHANVGSLYKRLDLITELEKLNSGEGRPQFTDLNAVERATVLKNIRSTAFARSQAKRVAGGEHV